MLISNVHKNVIVINSIETRFSRNVFEVPPSLTASGGSQIKQTDENTRNYDPEFRLIQNWLLQT